MRNRILLVIGALLLLPGLAFAQLRATPVVTGLSMPVGFIQDPSDAGNQFVVQQDARIRVVRHGVLQSEDFLNLQSQVGWGGELGLLGMAIPADYATSRRFYLCFTDKFGALVVARFKRDAANPLRADPASRFDLRWSTGIASSSLHNYGGSIAFGADGYLYVALGDGDPGGGHTSQDPQRLLGKMLRIDTSVPDDDVKGFVVPASNPFRESSRPEIWSFGLRDPWGLSVDDMSRGGTGALVFGDRSGGQRDEIDYEPLGRGGRNYGWPVRVGTIANPSGGTPAFTPLTDPILDFGEANFRLTGGFVYRGLALPSYVGRYFYADYTYGRIWSVALSVDSATGEATPSDIREHTAELSPASVSAFGVDAQGELYFANWTTGVIYRIEPAGPGPTMSVDRTSLTFGAVAANGAFTTKTDPQTIRLTQSGAGIVNWTATSPAPWLVVSPTSGTGPGVVTVSVQTPPAPIPPDQTANLTFSFIGASTSPRSIPVRLRVMEQSSPPVGAFDTPADGTTGLSGSVAVTGWAVDDVQTARVRIWRDPVGGETPGVLVLVGDAIFVEGARPDVPAAFPDMPLSYRAGWGYLMLSNFLPFEGNGTFRLHAIAEDSEGHATLLGTKTVGFDNASSIAPFGAIDTPGQGETVGGIVTNFGWVLSRGTRRADPPGGGTVHVVLDGVVTGIVPTGWTSRGDISALFPAAQYAGVNSAVGHAMIDTTTLADGVHTIAWIVTDNLGAAAGIGSRYFTVANGGSPMLAAPERRALTTSRKAFRHLPISGRRGFDPYGAWETFAPGADGRTTINIPELGRVELWLGTSATGHAMTPAGRVPLPIGSQLDTETGRFTWSPGAGFVGSYDLVFDGRTVRIVIGR